MTGVSSNRKVSSLSLFSSGSSESEFAIASICFRLCTCVVCGLKLSRIAGIRFLRGLFLNALFLAFAGDVLDDGLLGEMSDKGDRVAESWFADMRAGTVMGDTGVGPCLCLFFRVDLILLDASSPARGILVGDAISSSERPFPSSRSILIPCLESCSSTSPAGSSNQTLYSAPSLSGLCILLTKSSCVSVS